MWVGWLVSWLGQLVSWDDSSVGWPVLANDRQEPFNAEQCSIALAGNSAYIAGINIFWLNILSSLTPGVPLDRLRVGALSKFLWPESAKFQPAFILQLISVVLPEPGFDVLSHKGSLVLCSPEELVHAAIMAAAEAIRTTPPGPESDKLERWREIFLSVPTSFVLQDEHDVFFKAFTNRQELVQTYDTVRRTAYQSAWELVSFKEAQEKRQAKRLTPAEVVMLFRTARVATSSEEINVGNITTCIQVVNNIGSQSRIVDCITSLEASYGIKSCLNSMSKLAGIAKITPKEARVWVAEGLVYVLTIKRFENENMSKNFLCGIQGQSHSPGLYAVLEFKFKVLKYILQRLATSGLAAEEIRLMEASTPSHPEYAKATSSEVSWMSKLSEPALLAFKLLEAGHCFLTVW